MVGVIRAAMSAQGLRGPYVDFILTGIRMLNDHSLEYVTGASAPPWTWPVGEQVIDIVHKFVYAWATGLVSLPCVSVHRG